MKTTKKIIAVVLSVMLLLSVMPFAAFAEDLNGLPTVTATDSTAAGYDTAYVYTYANDASAEYANYYGDITVSFNRAIEADDVVLAGAYDNFNSGNWNVVQLRDLAAGEEFRIVKDGLVGSAVKFSQLLAITGGVFRCAAKGIDVSGVTMTVKFNLYATKTSTEAIEIASGTKTYTFPAANYVAEVNGTGYATLEEAIAAANAGDTVKLLADVTATSVLTLNNAQNLKIHLNGKTITADGNGKTAANVPHIKVYPGTQLSIYGPGSIVTANTPNPYDGALIKVYGAADDSGAASQTNIYDGAVISSSGYGISLFPAAGTKAAYNATIAVSNGTVENTSTHDAAAIAVSGNIQSGDSTITIAKATITGNSTKGVGVFVGGNASVSFNSSSVATVSGATGIYQKGGKVTFGETASNVTVTGNGASADYKFYGNGFVATGDAYVVDNCGYPAGVPVSTINNGKFTSENGEAVASYTKQDDSRYPDATFERVDEVIPATSTAVFSSDVSELAADDYKTVYDETAGGYVVAPIAYGTVTANATITGSGTAHERIVFENTSLTYADPNPSVGRYYAGYYCSTTKFIAPEGTVISQNARYTNGSIDSQTGQLKVKNLYNAKDGENWMGSWPYVTEESLKEAIAAGVNKTWTYTFDWDGDGIFEQEAIIEIVCDTVTLVKDGQQIYPVPANNGANLTLEGNIEEAIYLDADAYNLGDDAVVKVTANANSNISETPDVQTKTYAVSSLTPYTDPNGTYTGTYKFAVKNAPAQITEKVTVALYASADAQEPVETIEYSVKDYCDNVIEKSNDAKLVALCESILDYGAAAQKEFDYNTDNMAVDTYYNAEAIANLVYSDITGTLNYSTLPFTGIAFECLSTLNFNFYVTGKPDITEATVIGDDSSAIKATLKQSTKTGKIFVNVSGIEAGNLHNTFAVYTSEGSIETNLNTLVKTCLYYGSSVELAKTIYFYANAADLYFN